MPCWCGILASVFHLLMVRQRHSCHPRRHRHMAQVSHPPPSRSRHTSSPRPGSHPLAHDPVGSMATSRRVGLSVTARTGQWTTSMLFALLIRPVYSTIGMLQTIHIVVLQRVDGMVASFHHPLVACTRLLVVPSPVQQIGCPAVRASHVLLAERALFPTGMQATTEGARATVV